MYVTAARAMKAGSMSMDGGSILKREIKTAFSVSLKYRSPQQKPVAKPLYHNTAKGRKQRSLVRAAESINAANVRLEKSEENKDGKKPKVGSLIDDVRMSER